MTFYLCLQQQNVEAAVWADVFVHRDGLEMPVNVPSAMNHVLTAKG